MTLQIKPGVRIIGIKSEANLGVQIVASVFAKHGIDCVITSVVDGKHSRASIHYSGGAVDFRIRDIPPTLLSSITLEIKEALGGDFDFILEGNHYHMEWQPKEPY